MRTTLDLEDDILIAAKELATRQRRSASEVISERARIGLDSLLNPHLSHIGVLEPEAFYGFIPLKGGVRVTNTSTSIVCAMR